MKFNCLALAAFGLEGIVARELKRMGFDAKGEIGGARFQANYEEILSANIRLRCADRVLLILKEQKALSFDEIFDIVSTIDWKNIIPKNAKINIKAKCVRSQIMSPRDCQSITKKAIIKNLQKAYNSNNILENGIDFNIDLALVNDIFRISLNTSGEALNKRGYRVGYGKGFYDRYLKGKNLLSIGICFEFQITDLDLQNEFDIPVDYICTEKSIYKVGGLHE